LKEQAKRDKITGFVVALSLILTLTIMVPTRVEAQQATVYISPAAYAVPSVGSTFSVNITVQDVQNLYGWEFKLYYPNDILNGTSAVEGPFLKSGGVNTYFLLANFTDNYNATQGQANLLCLRTGEVQGVNGNGTLATITFTSTSANGPEALHLEDVKLSDPNAAQIPSTTGDAEVTVIPEFPPTLILPLLTIVASVAVALRKRILNHRGIFHSV
jgi:hypothetical protein